MNLLGNFEIDYKDFSIWENNYNSSSEFKILENNWKEKFNNVEIPVINLPYVFLFHNKKLLMEIHYIQQFLMKPLKK